MKKIIEYLNKIDIETKKIKADFPDLDLIFSYRGEKKDYGESRLMPSLFRSKEGEILDTERKLLESLNDYGVSKSSKSLLKMAIDSQHYIAKSRLLDVSFNSLVALFFALDPEKQPEDNLCEKCKDNERFCYVYVIAMPKEMVFSANSNYINETFNNVVGGGFKNVFGENVKLIMNSVENDRIVSQDGGFVFFPGEDFIKLPSWYYRKIPIEKSYRKDMVDALNDYFNITISKIYPEKSYKGKKIDIDISNRIYYEPDDITAELEMYKRKVINDLNFNKRQFIHDNKISEEKYMRLKRALFNDWDYKLIQFNKWVKDNSIDSKYTDKINNIEKEMNLIKVVL